jgi:hypothetical protein
MQTDHEYQSHHGDTVVIRIVAGTFAISVLAAFVVPGTLTTALCFIIPFIGTAYLCGKTSASHGATVKERMSDTGLLPAGEASESVAA